MRGTKSCGARRQDGLKCRGKRERNPGDSMVFFDVNRWFFRWNFHDFAEISINMVSKLGKVLILHAAPGSGQGLTWLKYGRYKSLQVWDPSRITGKPSHHPLNIFGYCGGRHFRAPRFRRLSNSDLPTWTRPGHPANPNQIRPKNRGFSSAPPTDHNGWSWDGC